MSEYSDCYYCKGKVKEQNISREIWWKGKLYVFENVPAGVCSQCGEKVIKPETAKHIDFLASFMRRLTLFQYRFF